MIIRRKRFKQLEAERDAALKKLDEVDQFRRDLMRQFSTTSDHVQVDKVTKRLWQILWNKRLLLKEFP